MKNKLKEILLTCVILYLGIVLIIGDRLPIVHSLIFTAFTVWWYVLVCMHNNENGLSKVFFIKDLCVLLIINLAFLDYIKNRFLVYCIYIVLLGIGLYCLYYLYNVDNGYRKSIELEEQQHAKYRERFRGDKEMEEFFAPKGKEECNKTFLKQGVKDFCLYMVSPCLITVFKDVINIIVNMLN